MLEYAVLVVAANVVMFGCLYFMRHIIAFRFSVLALAVGISIVYCLAYPLLASLVNFPFIIYLYLLLVFAGSCGLYLFEKRHVFRAPPQQDFSGMTVRDAAAMIAGRVSFRDVSKIREAGGKKSGGDVYWQSNSQDAVFSDEPAESPLEDQEPVMQQALAEEPPAEAVEPEEPAAGLGDVLLPDDLNGLITGGFELLARGEYCNAVRFLMEVFRHDPDPRLAVMTGLEVATVYYKQKQLDQALSVLDMVARGWGSAAGGYELERIENLKKFIRGENK